MNKRFIVVMLLGLLLLLHCLPTLAQDDLVLQDQGEGIQILDLVAVSSVASDDPVASFAMYHFDYGVLKLSLHTSSQTEPLNHFVMPNKCDGVILSVNAHSKDGEWEYEFSFISEKNGALCVVIVRGDTLISDPNVQVDGDNPFTLRQYVLNGQVVSFNYTGNVCEVVANDQSIQAACIRPEVVGEKNLVFVSPDRTELMAINVDGEISRYDLAEELFKHYSDVSYSDAQIRSLQAPTTDYCADEGLLVYLQGDADVDGWYCINYDLQIQVPNSTLAITANSMPRSAQLGNRLMLVLDNGVMVEIINNELVVETGP